MCMRAVLLRAQRFQGRASPEKLRNRPTAMATSGDQASQVPEECSGPVSLEPHITERMRRIIGSAFSSWEVCSSNEQMFHEGPVRIGREHILCTSNILRHNRPTTTIEIVRVNLSSGQWDTLQNHSIVMANGATADHKGGVIICSQGHFSGEGAGLHRLNPWTGRSEPIITKQPCSPDGDTFNSPNDVVLTRSGKLAFFSDPAYGFHQGIRAGIPDSPDAIWRVDLENNRSRPVDLSLVKPNGVQFSPDEHVLYATDTGYFNGAEIDPSKPRCLHKYIVDSDSGGLHHCQHFADVSEGVPDGLKCDEEGNVYAGCGSGVFIWSRGGEFIGKLLVEGGVSNFVFAGPENRTLVMCNEMRLLACNLDVKGDLTNGIGTSPSP